MLPYVIDNEEHRPADVLAGLLAEHHGRAIGRDLDALPFDEGTLRLVEELIRHLRRDSVEVRVADIERRYPGRSSSRTSRVFGSSCASSK